MDNYTADTYEVKREIMNFSKKMARGLSKPTQKFIADMMYGMHRSGSGLLSDIARKLNEPTKLSNIIDRLSTNLLELTERERQQLWANYRKEVKEEISDEPVFLFDDTDIAKPYGKAFEDLDKIRDGSDPNKKIVSGYNVCECVVLSEKEKQPLSIYSEIYSSKSPDFKSQNTYTLESIKEARKLADGKKMTCVLDRFYDSNQIIEELDKEDCTFIIRLKENRTFWFKNSVKAVGTVARERKGKIKMTLLFDDNEEHDVYISHTRVSLPNNKREYLLVIVYGLSEEKPLLLLTNQQIGAKEDIISVVRHYFYRWRVEEYFRVKKQEYGFEKMRVRKLKAINNLNLLNTMVLGHIGQIAESLDVKLLGIKILVRGKPLRSRVLFWHYQLAKGIREILAYAKTGINKLQRIEVRSSVIQLRLNL